MVTSKAGPAVIAVALVAGVFTIASLAIGGRITDVNAGGPGVDQMLIDMDPGASPGNTATSIGSVEFCARVNDNGAVDADEDQVDAIDLDVVVGPEGIPDGSPMIAFEFVLGYPVGVVFVSAEDPIYLLASGPVGELFDAGEPLPDSDGSFVSGALDIQSNTPEHVGDVGPGVLARLNLEIVDGASAGVFPLQLGFAGPGDDYPDYAGGFVDTPPLIIDPSAELTDIDNVIDSDADGFPDTVRERASIAVDTECPKEAPAPVTPAPDRTPTPNPTAHVAVVATYTPVASMTPANFPQTGASEPDQGAGMIALIFVGGGLTFGSAAILFINSRSTRLR